MVLCGWWVCVCIKGGFSPVSRAHVAAGGVRSPQNRAFFGRLGGPTDVAGNKGFVGEKQRFSLFFVKYRLG